MQYIADYLEKESLSAVDQRRFLWRAMTNLTTAALADSQDR